MKLVTKPDDPFDYLLGLKKGGFQRTHGDEFDPSQLAKSGPIIGLASVEDREIDIARQIREVVESNIVIPKDMYIDDGDMPTAQNFYQWITEDRFGAIGEERPFMEQLIWATIAFNDACHVCSDKEWLYHTHKVDDTYAKFERKVALFEFGRCPHCGTTRADQINKGQMKYINELAVNAGQRCVVANTPVLTEHGVFRIVDTLPQNLAYGFTPFSLNVHNGTEIEATSFAFKAKPEPIYKVTFSNGCWIAGTKDHPILTKDGFVTLGDITVGTPVDFQYGMRQFGTVQLPKDEARIHGINFSHGDIPPRLRLGNAAVYEEFLRGLFLSCNRRAFSNMDVLNDVSAMLFNVGVPHRIEAPSIVLSPEQYDLLHGGVFERGSVAETVTSVKIDGTAETFDYTLPSSHRFVTGGVISHNSGKSQTVGGFLSPYLTHRMLKLQKPAAYYGLTRNTVLHGTFVALTYVQAKDTLWTPFYGAISESKWFREYHALMRHYENKYGESLLKFNDTFVMYRHRGLTVYPAGPDRRILRGRTRFLASCDEIAYFDSNKDSAKVKVNAHEIYDALTNSLYTLRAAAERLVRHGYEDVFSGYSMNVTSPVAKNDMIHVLGKRAEESDSMYYVHRPTWEVNPDFPRNSKLITEAYRKDPESADKNFGANPPLIANPFLSNHKMIRDLEDFDRKNAIRVRPVMKNSIKAGQGYMYGELDKIKRRKQASMCAIDAGSTDNSFSIAAGHRDGLNLVVDLVAEVIPLPGFRINHSLTYSELILPVMEARNVRVLLADRWNSIKLLDDAALDRGDPDSEEPTFIAKQYSLKYRDLVSVRTCIEQGIVRLPKAEIPVKTLLDVQDSDYREFYAGKPVAHLFKQLFTIKDLEKSVGKGDGYTDDTWRAVALLVWGLLEEEFAGFLEAAPDEVVTTRPSALAASKLYSGGGGSVGNGGGSLTTINGAPLAMIGRGKR